MNTITTKYFNKNLVYPIVDLKELCYFDNQAWLSNFNIEWMSGILLKNNRCKNVRILTPYQGRTILMCSNNKESITSYLCDNLPIRHTEWLIPFNPNGNHWMLVVVDFILRIFTLIDPMNSFSISDEVYFTEFKVFLEQLKTKANPKLSKIEADSYKLNKWINKNVPHDLQTDNDNCGTFVIMYIERYLQGASMINLDSPIDYRVRCKNKIIQHVETNLCLYCGSSKLSKAQFKCLSCERLICSKCSRVSINLCCLCERYKQNESNKLQ